MAAVSRPGEGLGGHSDPSSEQPPTFPSGALVRVRWATGLLLNAALPIALDFFIFTYIFIFTLHAYVCDGSVIDQRQTEM